MAVQTRVREGVLEGRERRGALLFAGIPYAAPPTGERRFRAPEPHEGWSGTRDARRFGLAAPQHPGVGMTAAPLRWDEDCLTLNVTTPAVDDARRPVFFWIHGGAFRTGKGGIPWYDGTAFATRGDVVTVTINYRLGALGFTQLDAIGGADYEYSGVAGVLDQIAALEWVRDNIAAFGGDPERVTIAGESAGGMSVGTLLGSPRAKGLFRAAIPQSGAAHHTIGREGAHLVARELAHELRADSIEALLARSPDEILDAQDRAQESLAKKHGRVEIGGVGDMSFRPSIGSDALPEAPIDAIRGGLSRDVAVLAGTNRDETTLFQAGDVELDRLLRIAERIFGAGNGQAALETYRAARPGATPTELRDAITTDQTFRIPAVRLSEAHAESGGASWHYLFTWASRAFEGRLGATHALEIPFVFHTLEAPGFDVFLGPGPLPTPLADTMHAAWTAFVRAGDPACSALPEWPRYDADRRAVMELGDTCALQEDPAGAERALYERVL